MTTVTLMTITVMITRMVITMAMTTGTIIKGKSVLMGKEQTEVKRRLRRLF
jgi:hypothetical protein